MKLCLPFLALFFLAFSAQAQRIVVLPSPNKAASPVNEQIYDLLCAQTNAECVDAQRVMTQKKLDWNKVKKQRVRWIVSIQYQATPAQKGKPAQRKVTVLAQNASTRKVQLRPVYPLSSARTLSNKNAEKLSETFLTTLRIKPAFSPVAQHTPAPVAPAPPADTLRFEQTPPPEEMPPAALLAETMPPPVEKPSSEKPSAKKKPNPYPIAAAELGLHLFNHKHEFAQLSSDNLRSFRAGIQATPALRAEFYPLALADFGLASGIGLDFNFALSLGFKIQDEHANKFPMHWSSVDGGLRWRLQFSKQWRAAVTPMVGIQRTSLSHGALADGTQLVGFPSLKITAMRIGLGVELPFASDWVVIFGDFSYLPVLSAKELLAAPYFPEGSAFGLEGKLGLGIKLWGPLSLRFSGFLSRTNFKLNAAEGSEYVADSAAYQRLGLQMGVAASF